MSGDVESSSAYGDLNSARGPIRENYVRLKHKQKLNKSLDDEP